MPITPSYPGVYIQEVPSGVRTITGVSTSIGAFFGRTQKGPINKAVRCLSYSDFLREFGGPHPLSDLGSSVNQFFANGGTDCYVVRLAAGAGPSSVTLQNVANAKNVLTAVAKAPGTWGQGVKLSVDYDTTNPEDTFNLTVTHESGSTVIKTEVFNNLSMNPRSARFAPTFVTQSSRLVDLNLHADMEDPNLPGSFINNVTNTPRGFSQSRRVFTGTSAQNLMDNIRAAILPMVDMAIPAADRRSRFILNMDGNPQHDIDVNLEGIAIPTAPSAAQLTDPIQNRINAAIAPVLAGVTVTVSIDTFVTPGLNTNGGVLRIASNHLDGPNVNIRSAASNDFASLMMFGIDAGGIEVGRFANMRPVPNGTIFAGTVGTLNDLTLGANGLNNFSGLAENAMTAVAFDAALIPPPAPTTVNLVTQVPPPAPVPGNFVDAAGGNTGLIEKLRLIKDAINADVNSPCKAELWGYRLVFKKKSGTINETTTVITTNSAGVAVAVAAVAGATATAAVAAAVGAGATVPAAAAVNTAVVAAINATAGATAAVTATAAIAAAVGAGATVPAAAAVTTAVTTAVAPAVTAAATISATAAIFGKGFTRNSQRYSLGNLSTSPFELLPWPALTSGSDGTVPQQVEYEGNPITHTGFYALDTVDLVNLMVLPADREYDVASVRGAASTYCLSRRAFLLLDAPANWTDVDHPVADATTVNTFRIGVSKQHSAIFYPRVQYSDAGIKKYIGPSGMIAGLMARTDSQRGVWKAPAGIEADLRGLVDLEINMTDGENGVLNKLGVNCIRKFPNGIVSWGARTLDGSDDFGSDWKYIPIRRLALFLEESLFRGTKWVVFEPNDEPLWAKIRMNLNAFMMSLFRQGAFQGSTPDKAFFVKCDGETTTANDRNLGIVNIQVGFAPLKPAEFVIISIQQIPDL